MAPGLHPCHDLEFAIGDASASSCDSLSCQPNVMRRRGWPSESNRSSESALRLQTNSNRGLRVARPPIAKPYSGRRWGRSLPRRQAQDERTETIAPRDVAVQQRGLLWQVTGRASDVSCRRNSSRLPDDRVIRSRGETVSWSICAACHVRCSKLHSTIARPPNRGRMVPRRIPNMKLQELIIAGPHSAITLGNGLTPQFTVPASVAVDVQIDLEACLQANPHFSNCARC